VARPLTRRFYRRSSPELARALLGKRLVHRDRAGVIVETEAYLGPEDAASHARFGVTTRNAVMFGEAGFAYVYLCYGVHEMFNVVSGRSGVGGAVLIRALAPDRGLPDDPAVARGPGKLTRALGIDRSHSALDLTAGPPLYISAGVRVPPSAVATGPRIGVAYAGAWAGEPLRFWVRDHRSVS
jgi:DNA-3-methyladenine glycosylase